MEQSPNEKKLETVSFSAHVTRGLIRDQGTRRLAMGAVLVAAVLMIVLGSTLLESWLRERVLWFVLFWLACGWLTVTALLLAAFDLLLVRAEGRAARRAFREQLTTETQTRPAHRSEGEQERS